MKNPSQLKQMEQQKQKKHILSVLDLFQIVSICLNLSPIIKKTQVSQPWCPQDPFLHEAYGTSVAWTIGELAGIPLKWAKIRKGTRDDSTTTALQTSGNRWPFLNILKDVLMVWWLNARQKWPQESLKTQAVVMMWPTTSLPGIAMW